MTLTFNPEKYKEVLSEYQPRLIKTEAENERALAIVEQLMNSPYLSPEQEEIYELLVILIERFEQEFYKPDRSKNSGSMLSFLMDQRDFNPIDLVPIFASEAAVEEVISGRTNIDSYTADRLAELFHVDASLF
jgi:HTH-type transcriptional regulator / antitoxin HigA